MMQDVFDFIDSITVTKKNLLLTEQDEKRYARCRWLVRRGLSFSPDLIETVNMINTMSMSPQMEYEFFLNFIPVKIRRPRWSKKSAASLYMESVQQYYGYSETKAEQAIKILSVEQLAMIEKRIQKRDESWETFSGAMESK